MKAVYRTAALLSAAFVSATAFSQGRVTDDWKMFALDKSSTWNTPVDLFYLANQAHQLRNHNVLVWTEAVSVSAIRTYTTKQTFALANKKIDNRYIPPLYKSFGDTPKSTAERNVGATAMAMIIIAEEVADQVGCLKFPERKEQIEKLYKECQALNDKRVHIAHGLWNDGPEEFSVRVFNRPTYLWKQRCQSESTV